MKSSTIRRSTLSKESMEVIENLAKNQDGSGIDEYVRPDEIADSSYSESSNGSKSKEIDLLWQSFKAPQFNSKSPIAYVLMGFIAGVIVTIVLGLCLGFISTKSNVETSTDKNIVSAEIEANDSSVEQNSEERIVAPIENELSSDVTVSDKQSVNVEQKVTSSTKMKKYTVKESDTGESIIRNYYGSFSPEKLELVKKANNLESLDRINIDQVLLLPVQE